MSAAEHETLNPLASSGGDDSPRLADGFTFITMAASIIRVSSPPMENLGQALIRKGLTDRSSSTATSSAMSLKPRLALSVLDDDGLYVA